MFGIGMQELIIIAVIALLIVGPKKLPDLAKTIGKGFSEFRRAADGVTEDIKQAVKEDDEKPPNYGFKDSLLLRNNNSDESKPDSINKKSKQ